MTRCIYTIVLTRPFFLQLDSFLNNKTYSRTLRLKCINVFRTKVEQNDTLGVVSLRSILTNKCPYEALIDFFRFLFFVCVSFQYNIEPIIYNDDQINFCNIFSFLINSFLIKIKIATFSLEIIISG